MADLHIHTNRCDRACIDQAYSDGENSELANWLSRLDDPSDDLLARVQARANELSRAEYRRYGMSWSSMQAAEIAAVLAAVAEEIQHD